MHDIPVQLTQWSEDAVTISVLRVRATRIQITTERETTLWVVAGAILQKLDEEGPNPVWDALVAQHGDPFNGNSTINRRLRALESSRKEMLASV